MISEADATGIMQMMLDQLEQGGERLIDGVYYCKHDGKESCFFRKPNPGMVFEAYKSVGIDKDNLAYLPWFVGDTIRDIETAHNAGVRGLLVFTGRERPEDNAKWSHKPHAVAPSLKEAVDHIVQSGAK
jgi:D-glycero-D-manno-heptose 1,7-bisphosphate phosphatase